MSRKARTILKRQKNQFAVVAHWSMRRFTPQGWFLVLGYLACILFVPNVRSTMNYQLFSLLLTLLIISVLGIRFFKVRGAGFSMRRVLPRFATVGQPLRYELVLRNLNQPGAKSEKDLTVMENVQELALRVSDKPLAELEPGREARLVFNAVPEHRGLVRFTGCTVAAPEPLGLMRTFFNISSPGSVLVLPQRIPLPELDLPGAGGRQPLDAAATVTPLCGLGESREFFSLRDYRRGDPVRRIHWKSWAKTGKPIVMEFQNECFLRRALVLDTNQPETRNRARRRRLAFHFEEAVSLAASLASTPGRDQSMLDFLFTGKEMHAAGDMDTAGPADQNRNLNLLECLASVRPAPAKEFTALKDLVLGHAGFFAGCVLVLLDWDKERRDLVKGLNAGGVETMTFVVSDREDLLAPDPDDRAAFGLGHGRVRVLRPGNLARDLEPGMVP